VRWSASLVLVVVAATGCGSGSDGPRLAVTPATASVDVPFTLRGSGFPADRRAVVAFSGRAGGHVLRGSLTGRTDEHGRIALGDRYLLARLKTTPGQLVVFPRRLTVSVTSGGVHAAAQARRLPLDTSAVITTDERLPHAGIYGEWIRPRDARKRTAILMFGGSEGALSQGSLATTLAAHGYPVLHLAYFAEPGLPQSLLRIPLEYFEHALHWLATQPEVDPRHIVTFGWSRGGEASLILASLFPQLVSASIAYVPSAYVYPAVVDPTAPAWTYRGRPYGGDPPPGGTWRFSVIPVERADGPLFLVGGDDDELWPSGRFVRTVAARLRAHGRRHFVALTYPGAGHGIAEAIPPQIPISPKGYGLVDSNYGRLDLGGSPAADEHALEQSWPKLLAFLARQR
jgi:dienelactone hydrolase